MNVSAAFHSSLLVPMKDEFKEALEELTYSPPQKPVIRNFDTKIYINKEDIIEGLVEQINNTVLFKRSLQLCLEEDIKKYIDVSDSAFLRSYVLGWRGRHYHNNYKTECYRLRDIETSRCFSFFIELRINFVFYVKLIQINL